MTYEATHIKTKWQKKEMAIEYKKEGMSDREIAIQLDIDNHTVAAYLKNVSLKQELPLDDPEADLTPKMDVEQEKLDRAIQRVFQSSNLMTRNARFEINFNIKIT